MSYLTRRSFFQKTAGTLAAGAALTMVPKLSAQSENLETVVLGKTGIKVSYLALGTGTNGGRFHSNQIRMGLKPFVTMAQHAYDSGIFFFETADMYGTQRYIHDAIKNIPREKLVLMTKIWVQPNSWMKILSVEQFLKMSMREFGTDYIDIVLIHCMTSKNWLEETKEWRDGFSEAKEKGTIRAHGVSCHSLQALEAAADSEWVDVLLSRINPKGAHMDDTPEKVLPVLERAKKRGAGVIGMKIYAQGDFDQAERKASLEFVCKNQNVDAITIGFESPEQITETIGDIARFRKS